MATLRHTTDKKGNIELSIGVAPITSRSYGNHLESTPLFCRFWSDSDNQSETMDDAIHTAKAGVGPVGMTSKAEWILEYCDHQEVPELYHEGGHVHAFRPGQVVNFKGCFHRINRIMAIPSLFCHNIFAGVMSAVIEIECWTGKKYVHVDQIKRVRRTKKVHDLIAPAREEFLSAGQECEVGDFI